MTENITTTEGDEYHALYWMRSPEYTRTVSRYGRMLTPDNVRGILSAHGMGEEELLADEHDNVTGDATELPERFDAAMLYAWLGY